MGQWDWLAEEVMGTERLQDPVLGAREHVVAAIAAASRSDGAAALDACGAALACDDLVAEDVGRIVRLMRAYGRNAEADQIEQRLCETMEAAIAADDANAALLREWGKLLDFLERPEGARSVLERACALDHADGEATTLLVMLLLDAGELELAVQTVMRHLKFCENAPQRHLVYAKLFAHRGYGEAADRMLDAAEPLFVSNRAAFERNARAIRAEPTADQHAETVTIFDGFAASYDENLAQIGNRGPELIGRIMGEMHDTAEARFDIFDAGCGTGLCGPYLRPYARRLQGADLSVAMLERSKARGCYDLLCRTDLSRRETYPEGLFDVVACADVLVYFSALDEVLANLFACLRPGGLLCFTVEALGSEAELPGYKRQSSGRYAHSAGYVTRAVKAAHFAAPSLLRQEVIRHEFGDPVMCHAVAVRKPAIAL